MKSFKTVCYTHLLLYFHQRTYSYVKEGFDLPTLDAMILATPRSDVVQACGRILRFNTRLSPTIIDVVDEWFIGKAQFNKRKVYYERSGFVLSTTNG
jgi:hypothetical protein